MLNINSFGRWLFRGSVPPYNESDLCKNLRALASGLVSDKVLAAPRKYRDCDMPVYAEVFERALSFIEATKSAGNVAPTSVEEAWVYQAALVLASQFLLPPMRGKPFWLLSVQDSDEASMFQYSNLSSSNHVTDYLAIQDGRVSLTLRAHKTSKTVGLVTIKLPDDVAHMYATWVKAHRPFLLAHFGQRHDMVFLQEQSAKPFDCKTFSCYFSKQMLLHTGTRVTLQLVRRLFVKGVSFHPTAEGAIFFPRDRLPR